jgi:hypothetical protein
MMHYDLKGQKVKVLVTVMPEKQFDEDEAGEELEKDVEDIEEGADDVV